jgi:hypothetical protein
MRAQFGLTIGGNLDLTNEGSVWLGLTKNRAKFGLI